MLDNWTLKQFPPCLIVGRNSIAWSTSYGVSKYALEGLGQSLRQELSLVGVSVSMIDPGEKPYCEI